MSNHGYRAIDADLHLIEPPDLWEKYIEPAFKEMAPKGSLIPEMGGRDMLLYHNGKLPHHDIYDPTLWYKAIAKHIGPAEKNYEFAISRGWSPESEIMAMDMEGLEIGVMFP